MVLLYSNIKPDLQTSRQKDKKTFKQGQNTIDRKKRRQTHRENDTQTDLTIDRDINGHHHNRRAAVK